MNNTIEDEKTTDSERVIHTPSSFARRNLIYAQETGRLKSLKEHSCVRENLESYLFFIVLDGTGYVTVGGKEYKAEKGDIIFLDCRKHYEHRSDVNNPWEIRWVHFNGQMVAALFPLFQEGNLDKPVFTPANGVDVYLEKLDELNTALGNKISLAEIHQSGILEDILVACIDEVSKDKTLTTLSEGNIQDSNVFSTLRESVNEHIGEPGLERLLAIQYGIQPEELNTLFKKKYGISLSDYIVNRKLNKAKELLRFTIKTVDEIVFESGIEDEVRFRELFNETEEMTPEDYRKRWAQWIKA